MSSFAGRCTFFGFIHIFIQYFVSKILTKCHNRFLSFSLFYALMIEPIVRFYLTIFFFTFCLLLTCEKNNFGWIWIKASKPWMSLLLSLFHNLLVLRIYLISFFSVGWLTINLLSHCERVLTVSYYSSCLGKNRHPWVDINYMNVVIVFILEHDIWIFYLER